MKQPLLEVGSLKSGSRKSTCILGFIAFVSFVLLTLLVQAHPIQSERQVGQLESWMSQLHPTTPIRRMVIPGTHHSEGYAWTAVVEGNKKARAVVKGCPPKGGKKDLSCAFKCQADGFDMTAQLNAGIRYFDWRIAPYEDRMGTCPIPVGHMKFSPEGCPFFEAWDALQQFLVENPNEIIIYKLKQEGHWAPKIKNNAEIIANIQQWLRNVEFFLPTEPIRRTPQGLAASKITTLGDIWKVPAPKRLILLGLEDLLYKVLPGVIYNRKKEKKEKKKSGYIMKWLDCSNPVAQFRVGSATVFPHESFIPWAPPSDASAYNAMIALLKNERWPSLNEAGDKKAEKKEDKRIAKEQKVVEKQNKKLADGEQSPQPERQEVKRKPEKCFLLELQSKEGHNSGERLVVPQEVSPPIVGSKREPPASEEEGSDFNPATASSSGETSGDGDALYPGDVEEDDEDDTDSRGFRDNPPCRVIVLCGANTKEKCAYKTLPGQPDYCAGSDDMILTFEDNLDPSQIPESTHQFLDFLLASNLYKYSWAEKKNIDAWKNWKTKTTPGKKETKTKEVLEAEKWPSVKGNRDLKFLRLGYTDEWAWNVFGGVLEADTQHWSHENMPAMFAYGNSEDELSSVWSPRHNIVSFDYATTKTSQIQRIMEVNAHYFSGPVQPKPQPKPKLGRSAAIVAQVVVDGAKRLTKD